MRRNLLISSRIFVQSLLYNPIIKNDFFTKCFCQYNKCEESKIPKISLVPARFYTQCNEINCWSCHKPLHISIAGTKESFFCSSCGSLQEVNINYVREWKYIPLVISLINYLQNYFSLFGITEHFALNQNELTKKFREFQSVLHPDKFSNK